LETLTNTHIFKFRIVRYPPSRLFLTEFCGQLRAIWSDMITRDLKITHQRVFFMIEITVGRIAPNANFSWSKFREVKTVKLLVFTGGVLRDGYK